MRHTLALAALVTLAGAEPGWADNAPATISDALRRPSFRESYNRMFINGGAMRSWYASAAEAFHGRDQSHSTVDVEGRTMFSLTFCEPPRCDSGLFTVLFDADGRRAVGASDVNGALQLFGGPTVFEAERLTGSFLP